MSESIPCVATNVLLARPAQPAGLPLSAATNRVPPLELKSAEALLIRAGYRPVLADAMIERRCNASIIETARRVRPAWALLSLLEFQQNDLAELDRLVNGLAELGTNVLLSGHYPSFEPAATLSRLSGVAAVLRGEPEEALLDALNAGLSKLDQVRGAATRDNTQAELRTVPELDALPDPLWSPRDVRRYYQRYPLPAAFRPRWGSIMASRGCPRGCSFCSPFSRVSFGATHRRLSVERVARRARQLKDVGANALSFEDDAFSAERAWTLDVYRALQPLGLRLIHHARADELDRELLERMAQAGGLLLKVGVETGSPAVAERIGKTTDGAEWVRRVERLGRDCRELGIALCALLIVGCPGENEQDLQLSLELVRRSRADLVQIHYFTPYPGSVEHGRLAPEARPDPAALHHYAPLPGRAETARSVSRLARDFFLRPGYLLQHLRRFGGFYLRNPGTALGLLRGLIRLGD